ncbi:MAG: hypothetical protein RIQ81_1916 [Pseudomonadota bacterium]
MNHCAFLAFDVGGTKVEAALAEVREGRVVRFDSVRIPTGNHHDFRGVVEAVEKALPGESFGTLDGVAVAVAGPVVNGRASLTNVAWGVEEEWLRKRFSGARCRLINDMQAHGYAAVALLARRQGRNIPDGLLVQNSEMFPEAHADPHGSSCVIAPGTGLGEGFIVWTGDQYIPVASEGGHASFSPINDEQMRLLNFLRHTQGHKHVSWERLVSGKFGLPNLLLFVTKELALKPADPDLEKAVMEGGHPVQALTTAAASGDPVAGKVLEMFMGLMGQETGNLALKVLATGGVFISGGLAQRMNELLKGKYLEAFREGMCAKGRFRPLLSKLPVTFLEDGQTALKGAMASVVI